MLNQLFDEVVREVEAVAREGNFDMVIKNQSPEKDVTDRKWLERQALHDPLTHLPNRLLLMDRARQALTRLHRSSNVVAMMFIDLDKFKAVNDNLGHDIGDRLLVAIASRLAELMPEYKRHVSWLKKNGRFLTLGDD